MDKLAYRPQRLAAIKRGSLCQWLSVFYHEDPHNEFLETYSYEHKLEEWINELGEIDAHHKFYKRFCDARQQTASKYQEVRESYFHAKRKEQLWRGIFFLLAWAAAYLCTALAKVFDHGAKLQKESDETL